MKWPSRLWGLLSLRKWGTSSVPLNHDCSYSAGHHEVYQTENRKWSQLSWQRIGFGRNGFAKYTQERVNAVGRSRISGADDHMPSTTHFRSRCTRLLHTCMGIDKTKSKICIDNGFWGRWDLIDKGPKELLQECVQYDMKWQPHTGCARKESISWKTEKEKGKTTALLPWERVASLNWQWSQIALKYSDAVATRKEAASRSDFNDWAWNQVLDRKKVDRKLKKGFCFHHEISTNGVSVSILYSGPEAAAAAAAAENNSRAEIEMSKIKTSRSGPRKAKYRHNDWSLSKIHHHAEMLWK